jgi:hypothetical protein
MVNISITVAPVQGGWVVASPFSDCDLLFLSGARAEAKARELAHLAVALGMVADVKVHDRKAALIATRVYATA